MLTEIPKLVINLPNRADRLELFYKELKWFPYPVEVMPGVIDPTPLKGIAQAHMNCIKRAKDNNWPSVLIMEDDLVFQGKDKTVPYLTEALSSAPADWDVLLGGLYESRFTSKVNEYWSKTGEFCGIHFYFVNKSAYDTLITHDGTTHFDRYINKGSKKLNCYVTNKFIATQRSGYSDQRKKYVDDSDRIKRFQLL